MLVLKVVSKVSKHHKSINKSCICSSAIDSAKDVHYTVISYRSDIFPAIIKHYLHMVANISIFYLEAVVHQINIKKIPNQARQTFRTSPHKRKHILFLKISDLFEKLLVHQTFYHVT